MTKRPKSKPRPKLKPVPEAPDPVMDKKMEEYLRSIGEWKKK